MNRSAASHSEIHTYKQSLYSAKSIHTQLYRILNVVIDFAFPDPTTSNRRRHVRYTTNFQWQRILSPLKPVIGNLRLHTHIHTHTLITHHSSLKHTNLSNTHITLKEFAELLIMHYQVITMFVLLSLIRTLKTR